MHIFHRAHSVSPQPFRERIRAADHMLHAGDFDSKGALTDQRKLAPVLTAVSGNMDPTVGLPSVASVDLGRVSWIAAWLARPCGRDGR